jgi:hypothetical protein
MITDDETTEVQAEPAQITEFVVDRFRWLRGGQGVSYLLRPIDRNMCCLGFLGAACGYTDHQMLGVVLPRAIHDKGARYPVELREHIEDIVATNDAVKISDEEREIELKVLFAKAGVKVTFEG